VLISNISASKNIPVIVYCTWQFARFSFQLKHGDCRPVSVACDALGSEWSLDGSELDYVVCKSRYLQLHFCTEGEKN
jgi:hypothetical protein